MQTFLPQNVDFLFLSENGPPRCYVPRNTFENFPLKAMNQ